MDYWNLIVVLCFSVLYLGLSVVFSRLRRVQNEMREHHEQLRQRQDPNLAAQASADLIAERLMVMEKKISLQIQTSGSATIGPQLATLEEKISLQIQATRERLQGDIQTIHGELRFVSRQEDTYREARMLLSHGVDEERVVAETGQTMEEIRLLKRVTHLNNRFGNHNDQPPVRAESITAPGWDYPPPPLDGFMPNRDDQNQNLVVMPNMNNAISHQDHERHGQPLAGEQYNNSGYHAETKQDKHHGHHGHHGHHEQHGHRKTYDNPNRQNKHDKQSKQNKRDNLNKQNNPNNQELDSLNGDKSFAHQVQADPTFIKPRGQQKRQHHHGRKRHKNRKFMQKQNGQHKPVVPPVKAPDSTS